MVEFSIRPATMRDEAAIRNLIKRVRINPMGLDWHRFMVAVDPSGSLVGCGQLKRHGGGITEMASIAVEPAFRNKGIARSMIEYLILKAPRPLYLTCRQSMGRFYEQWGFRAMDTEEMPRYYRRLARLVSLLSAAFRSEEMLVMMLK